MARIIKAARGRVVPAQVYDAYEHARRIVEGAREKATEILSQGQAAAAQSCERARREGLEVAHAETTAAALSAARARDELLADAEHELVKLAIVAARRIVGEELALVPERIETIVKEALDRVRRARVVTIRVHPADLEAARRYMAASPFAQVASIDVEPSDELSRGGCTIATELGTIDARVETKLEALAHALEAKR